jgi:hypothetical protein
LKIKLDAEHAEVVATKEQEKRFIEGKLRQGELAREELEREKE